MHTNQVESPGLVCLGRGDGLKNGKKMRFARSGPFSQILYITYNNISYHNAKCIILCILQILVVTSRIVPIKTYIAKSTNSVQITRSIVIKFQCLLYNNIIHNVIIVDYK